MSRFGAVAQRAAKESQPLYVTLYNKPAVAAGEVKRCYVIQALGFV